MSLPQCVQFLNTETQFLMVFAYVLYRVAVHAFLEIHDHKNKLKFISEEQVTFDRKEIYMRRGADACIILPVLYM